MRNDTYEKDRQGKALWFKNNNKLVIVRYKDKFEGRVIGIFSEDYSAFEFVQLIMEREGKVITALEIPWMIFDGYLNTKNNTYKHKFIRSVCFRNRKGSKDSEMNFWFSIVKNSCIIK